MSLPKITSAKQLEALVLKIGFLPFFDSAVPGFSLKALTPYGYWFVDGVEGPWEWREEIAAGGKIAYGKLFENKAGFVSPEWYPDLCNYRRDGYDFDARYEDGLATRKCKLIVDVLSERGPMLSGDLKRAAGFEKGGLKGFDSAISLLQMQTYVTIKEFVYKKDRYGKPYGWGVGRYALSEDVFGEKVTNGRYDIAPMESKRAIVSHIQSLFPNADAAQIEKLIR